MLKKDTYFMLLGISICFVLILSGCGQSNDENTEAAADESNEVDQRDDEPENESEEEDKLDNDETSSEDNAGNESEMDNNDETSSNVSESEDTASTNESANENGNAGNKDDVKIANMDEAISHLKKELDRADELNVDDTEFIPDDSTDQTEGNEYIYTISLVSKSMREDGGSGTVGTYNVYENGEYELAY